MQIRLNYLSRRRMSPCFLWLYSSDALNDSSIYTSFAIRSIYMAWPWELQYYLQSASPRERIEYVVADKLIFWQDELVGDISLVDLSIEYALITSISCQINQTYFALCKLNIACSTKEKANANEFCSIMTMHTVVMAFEIYSFSCSFFDTQCCCCFLLFFLFFTRNCSLILCSKPMLSVRIIGKDQFVYQFFR